MSTQTYVLFHFILKTITTGEGGAITTNSKKLKELLIQFRSNGIIKDKKFVGYLNQ